MVLASGESYPDAMVAGAFAGLLTDYCSDRCGLVLTRGAALSPEAEAEIQRYFSEYWHDDGDTTVYIIGGTGAVSPAVMTTVSQLPYVDDVIRLSGVDRYATAVAAMEEIESEFDHDDDAYIVSGQSWADALAGGAAAVYDGDMLLFTRPDSLPKVVSDYLTSESLDEAVIVGGTAAISESVLTVGRCHRFG